MKFKISNPSFINFERCFLSITMQFILPQTTIIGRDQFPPEIFYCKNNIIQTVKTCATNIVPDQTAPGAVLSGTMCLLFSVKHRLKTRTDWTVFSIAR